MNLFPKMALMFAMTATTQHVRALYDRLLEGIKTADFSILDLAHHYTSGLKSVYT